MSDLHVWRPTRAASDAAMREFDDYHQVLEAWAKKEIAERGENDPAAHALRKVWNQLDELGTRMRRHLTEPVPLAANRPEPSRRMGEDTQAWVVSGGQVPMRRNRGPQ